jgi:hypothetical protein
MLASTRAPLAVQWVPIDSVKLDPRNPRHHSKRQLKQIARSIEAFGFNVPILIGENGLVLAGHGRVMASQVLGRQEIPVIRLTHLTEAQARAFSLADNRLVETSAWNEQLLGEILSDLASVELDFSLEATGFTMAEIDLRIEQLAEASESKPDPADTLPDIPDCPPLSRPGDLWLLGKHRVLCGSALDTVSYETLMRRQKAAAVFTDPPYNVPIDGNVSGKGSIHHREFAMASGEMTPAQFTDFLCTGFHLLVQHSVPGSLHFICMDWRHQFELLSAGQRAYSELKNLCVWVKNNGGMGSLYRSQHELVYVFKNGTGRHRNNVQLGQYGRNRTNVWSYPGVNNFGRGGEEGNLLKLHPTVKPVGLGGRCDPGLLRTWRHCVGSFSRQRVNPHRRRAGRANLLRRGDRPSLCRYAHSTLAALHRRNCGSRRNRRAFRTGPDCRGGASWLTTTTR